MCGSSSFVKSTKFCHIGAHTGHSHRWAQVSWAALLTLHITVLSLDPFSHRPLWCNYIFEPACGVSVSSYKFSTGAIAPTICAEFCICIYFAQGALCDPRLTWLQPSILVLTHTPFSFPTLALLALFFSKKPVFGLFAAICKLERIAGWMLTWKRSAHMLPNYELVP